MRRADIITKRGGESKKKGWVRGGLGNAPPPGPRRFDRETKRKEMVVTKSVGLGRGCFEIRGESGKTGKSSRLLRAKEEEGRRGKLSQRAGPKDSRKECRTLFERE